jgi:hypothetical protein
MAIPALEPSALGRDDVGGCPIKTLLRSEDLRAARLPNRRNTLMMRASV